METKNNWPLLGGLRFALALIVLSQHTAPAGGWGFSLLGWPAKGGAATAVIAFLMVSGFSIAHSISKQPEGFYQRRINRIMPVFVVAYFLALVPLALSAYYPASAVVLPPESLWTFFGNILPIQVIFVKALPSNGPTWSLGIECALYALAPLFLKCSRKTLCCLIGASALLFASSGRFGLDGPAELLNPLVLPALAWPWLLGWLIYHKRDNDWLQRLGAAFACAAYGMHVTSTERFIFFTVGGTAALLLFQGTIEVPAKMKKWLILAGDVSYPLYLTHMPLFLTISILWPSYWASPVAFLAAIALATVVHFLVERPLAKFPAKKREFKASPISP